MKLTINLTRDETLECMMAFGVIALLPQTLNFAAGFMHTVDGKPVSTPNDFCSYVEGYSPLTDLMSANNIKPSEAVDYVIDELFGFEGGSITRDNGDWVVTLCWCIKLNRTVVQDRYWLHKFITSSKYIIDIGTIC